LVSGQNSVGHKSSERATSKSKYRHLTVNGTEYKYVIGESYVKLVGPAGSKVVEKEKVSVTGENTGLITTPGMIVKYIQGKEIDAEDFFENCGHENRKLRVNPFMSEIHGKTFYFSMCEDCCNRMADDI
jgi:hypothetical protein